jgi:hypothetical protein
VELRHLIFRREHANPGLLTGLASLLGLEARQVRLVAAASADDDVVRLDVVRQRSATWRTRVELYVDEAAVTLPTRSAELALAAAVHFGDEVLTDVDGVVDFDPSPYLWCLALPSGELLLVVEDKEGPGGLPETIAAVRTVEPAAAR